MKVAIIHYRLTHMGGLESRFKNYIAYFNAKGHDVSVVYAKKAKSIVLPEGVKEIKVNLGVMPKKFRVWYFDRQLAKVMAKHNFDMSLSLGRTGHQTAVLAPCTHWGYLNALNQTKLGVKDKLEIDLDEKAYAASSQIYACSQMVKEEVRDLYHISEDKIKVIFPPLNNNIYRKLDTPQSELKKKLGLDQNKKALLFVSTSHKRKGLPLLLKMMNELKEQPFELCISGKPAVKSDLPNVKYMGYESDLSELYNAADFLVHPSIYEPFGQVISEAISCGTPAIVSSGVGAKEIIDENLGLVIDSLDPKEWAKKMIILKDKTFNIPEDVLDQYDIPLERHMDRMLSFFSEVHS